MILLAWLLTGGGYAMGILTVYVIFTASQKVGGG